MKMAVETAVRIPEIVERIFTNLDNKSLKQNRTVCKVWDDEAIRMLLKRKALPPLHPTTIVNSLRCEFNCSTLLRFLKLSRHPHSCVDTLNIDQYRVSLDKKTGLPKINTFASVIRQYGYIIKNVDLCDSTYHPQMLTCILGGCANLQKVRMDLWNMDLKNPDLLTHSIPINDLAIKTKKIHTIIFKFNSSNTHKIYEYVAPRFIIDLVIKMILSTNNLKILLVSSNFLLDFLQALNDLKIVSKLEKLQRLTLEYDMATLRSTHVQPDHYKAMILEKISELREQLQGGEGLIFEVHET